MTPKFLSVEDAAAYLGVPVSALRNNNRTRNRDKRAVVPSVRIGKRFWYSVAALDAFAATHQ